MNIENPLFDELDEAFIDPEDDLSLEAQHFQIIKHRLEMHPDCGDPFHPGCEQCLNVEFPNLDSFDFSSVMVGL